MTTVYQLIKPSDKPNNMRLIFGGFSFFLGGITGGLALIIFIGGGAVKDLGLTSLLFFILSNFLLWGKKLSFKKLRNRNLCKILNEFTSIIYTDRNSWDSFMELPITDIHIYLMQELYKTAGNFKDEETKERLRDIFGHFVKWNKEQQELNRIYNSNVLQLKLKAFDSLKQNIFQEIS